MNDARIADLVTRLERLPDRAARETAQELMAAVLELHGEALARLLELVADHADVLGAIAADPSLRPVLELHGLVPERAPTSSTPTPVTLLPTRHPAERCELCGAPAGDDHPHVVDLQAPPGSLACACPGCHFVLAAPGAGADRWRAVPDDWRAVDPVELADVPVGVAFIVVESQTGRPVAHYPGPAGATRSELDVPVALLPDLRADVEALVVRDGEAFVVPVSAAYGLVGELRARWSGLTGGDGPQQALDAFFARCRGNALRIPQRIPSANAT